MREFLRHRTSHRVDKSAYMFCTPVFPIVYSDIFFLERGRRPNKLCFGMPQTNIVLKKTINGKVTDSTYIDGMYEKTKLPSGVVEHKYNVGNTVVIDRRHVEKSSRAFIGESV